MWIIFMCKIFVLKYFRSSWQSIIIEHTKCILFTNIRAFNFRGSPAPRKYFNNEHFANYGICSLLSLIQRRDLLYMYNKLPCCSFPRLPWIWKYTHCYNISNWTTYMYTLLDKTLEDNKREEHLMHLDKKSKLPTEPTQCKGTCTCHSYTNSQGWTAHHLILSTIARVAS